MRQQDGITTNWRIKRGQCGSKWNNSRLTHQSHTALFHTALIPLLYPKLFCAYFQINELPLSKRQVSINRWARLAPPSFQRNRWATINCYKPSYTSWLMNMGRPYSNNIINHNATNLSLRNMHTNFLNSTVSGLVSPEANLQLILNKIQIYWWYCQ
jgi:hypothetical protein